MWGRLRRHGQGWLTGNLKRDGCHRKRRIRQRNAPARACHRGGEAEVPRGRVQEQQQVFAHAVAVAGGPEPIPFTEGERFAGSGAAQGVGDEERDADQADVTGGGRGCRLNLLYRAAEDDAGIAGQRAQVSSVLGRRQGQEQKRQEGDREYPSLYDINYRKPGT